MQEREKAARRPAEIGVERPPSRGATRSPTPLWEQQARQWQLVKPPLRPSGEDLVWAQEAIDRQVRCLHSAPAALMLGVTPELATLRWPQGSVVVAVDLSMPMIREVWPAFRMPGMGCAAIRADWMALPLADRWCDLVLSDNCFGACRRAQAIRIVHTVRRVLRAGGTFLFRTFVRPEPPERPEAVWDQLEARRIGSFHIFKFRLLMSLERGDGEVHVADAWEFFRSRCPEPESLARHLLWPVEEVRTIEAYRGQSAVYWFPTVAELRALAEGELEELDCLWPNYEMGDRCPTFVFQAPG
jgi:SAM-dependent methyltransferase